MIGEAEDAPGFFDAAGIESPGLSSAPAIGEYLAEDDRGKSCMRQGIRTSIRVQKRHRETHARLSTEERAELIRKNPAYGAIVCRCETISEGEIVDAITQYHSAHAPWMASNGAYVRAWDGARQASAHREPWKFSPVNWESAMDRDLQKPQQVPKC